MTEDEAERLGRIAYEACCAGGRPRGFDAPDPCEPWEDLPPESRAHFAREAAAVAVEVRRRERTKVAALADAILRALAGVRIEPDEEVVVHDPTAFNAGMIGLCNAIADLEETP